MTSRESNCPSCGAPLPPNPVSCPRCHHLLHRERLEAIARQARVSTPSEARALWQEALTLLPPRSNQAEAIRLRIASLPAEDPKTDRSPSSRPPPASWGWLGGVGLILWKSKAILVFALSKAKLLLTGLTKWKTVLSMLFALAAYWAIWGWWFALGFVLSIYVHEMGHVIALRHYGIAASPPMFIPGVGAFVAMKRYPETPVQNSRIGLAGPIFGLGATVCCLLAYQLTNAPIMAALTRTGAWINLFNLIPIWQLDGGRAFESLTRRQRWWATGAIAAALVLTTESMLWLLLFGSIYRAWTTPAPTEEDRAGLWLYGGLVGVLSWMTMVYVPGID